MTVSCSSCGETWPRDPALEVPCPTCHAKIGQACKRPSGHKAMDVHVARDKAAMKAGFLRKCRGRRRPEIQAGKKSPDADRNESAQAIRKTLRLYKSNDITERAAIGRLQEIARKQYVSRTESGTLDDNDFF